MAPRCKVITRVDGEGEEERKERDVRRGKWRSRRESKRGYREVVEKEGRRDKER